MFLARRGTARHGRRSFAGPTFRFGRGAPAPTPPLSRSRRARPHCVRAFRSGVHHRRLFMAISITPDLVHAPPPREPLVTSKVVKPPHVAWKAIVPVAVALAIALLPAPGGLAQHAWYFFAIFAGVIVALMLEPCPAPPSACSASRWRRSSRRGSSTVPPSSRSPASARRTRRSAGRCPGSRTHGLADLRRVHVRARLRQDRPRPADLARAGAGDGQAHAVARLRDDLRRRRCSRRSRRRTPRAPAARSSR